MFTDHVDDHNKCVRGHEVKVLKSSAGYYIGTTDCGQPYCRLSVEYYKTEKEAQFELDNRIFCERVDAMEIEFCKGDFKSCLKS